MLRKSLKLLIVGYSEEDSGCLCSVLADDGFDLVSECVMHVQGIQAAISESDWDVIVSNHTKTSFDAIEALDLLNRCGKNTPFIVYSDYVDEDVAVSVMRRGASDYLMKGNASRLILSIQRELRDMLVRRAKLQAESQIYRLSYYDQLTGLPKRNLFCEKVLKILSERNDAKTAAIYFIDLERMPRINSTYGYGVGDILIQQLSYRLSVYVRRSCLLTRIEGSKFVFFNCDVKSSEDVQLFANKILRLVATPFVINSLEFYVTLNVGICAYPKDGEDISMLLANAESTILLNRGLWRSQCRYYEKAVGETNSRRLKLEGSLRKSIENRELVLYYQPIVNMRTGSIIGAEALIRWNHPEFGMILPEQFIPIADETGFIIEMGKWVLMQACSQAKQWHDVGYDSLVVSVNISATELDQSQLLNHVNFALEQTGLYPGALELDITESVLMQDAESNIRILQEIKDIGVKIAVDDFGTGYSSLSYLKQLPIDILKIDRSFVREIASDSDSSAIVVAIISLAKSFSLFALAEGVESKEQFEFLCQEECDGAQGYLFSKPVNSEHFLLLLEQRKTGTLA